MDTTRAQEALKFQHYSWADMMAEMSAKFWFTRYWGRLLAPLVREIHEAPVGRTGTQPGQYADPWGVDPRASWATRRGISRRTA